jgi:hypothetical protein
MCRSLWKKLRYKKSNQKPWVEDGQTTQWKFTNGQTKIHTILHRKLKIDQHQPLKNRSEFMCSGKVSSCCSTTGTRRATHCGKSIICHEWREGVIVITTNRTYPRSFVTQILRNGLPRYGCDNKTNDLTEPLWTLHPVASLLAATRYGIFNKLPDRIE